MRICFTSLFLSSCITGALASHPSSGSDSKSNGKPNSKTSPASTAEPCICKEYSQIAAAVANCTDIVLSNIAAPNGSSIDLSSLKTGTTVTFEGLTTFGWVNSSSFNPITIGGEGITITAKRGAIIDGNGQAYWDGLGSNGGLPKPDHFIVVDKVTGNSVIEKLYIRNWPVHLFDITGCENVVFQDMTLNNAAGDAPNSRSDGLAAAHNSDGFDVSSSYNITIRRNFVHNQDDCVAITSGNNMTVSGMTCEGSHGLSIGSIGGKSNNNVTNIHFSDSLLINTQAGARIKTNYNYTGFVSNITYENIVLQNITQYGIDIQQDYLNGGPTGIPSNGVIIENVLMKNIKGYVASDAKPYYILCGDGSCSNIVFDDVKVTGGGASSCNYKVSGCPVSS